MHKPQLSMILERTSEKVRIRINEWGWDWWYGYWNGNESGERWGGEGRGGDE